MLQSDLFIGTSSGFAAMANFSRTPYFITRMNDESCNAYRIEPGCTQLPFATERQFLVYEPETPQLLMRLLERGLSDVAPRTGQPRQGPTDSVDASSWVEERRQSLFPSATTVRFVTDDHYSDGETAFLLQPKIEEARTAWQSGSHEEARAIVSRIESSFPRMSLKLPQLMRLKLSVAPEGADTAPLARRLLELERARVPAPPEPRSPPAFERALAAAYRAALRLYRAARARGLIPERLSAMMRRWARRPNS
jgi:hypothetical protein